MYLVHKANWLELNLDVKKWKTIQCFIKEREIPHVSTTNVGLGGTGYSCSPSCYPTGRWQGLFKLWCAWESSGDLVKCRFWSNRPGGGGSLRLCRYDKLPGDDDAGDLWIRLCLASPRQNLYRFFRKRLHIYGCIINIHLFIYKKE